MLVRPCEGSEGGEGGEGSGYPCFNSGLKEGSRGLSRFMEYGRRSWCY